MEHTKEPWHYNPGFKGLYDSIGQAVPMTEAALRRSAACVNALAGVKDPHEMRESIRGVIATLNGNFYGLDTADLLEALRMACRALEEAIGVKV